MAVATTASTKLERQSCQRRRCSASGPASQSTRRLIVARSCCRSLTIMGGFGPRSSTGSSDSSGGEASPADPAADAGGAPLDAGCAAIDAGGAAIDAGASAACAALRAETGAAGPARKIACGSGYLLGMSGGPRLLSFAARFHGGLRHGPARPPRSPSGGRGRLPARRSSRALSGPGPAHRGRNR